MFLDLSSTPAPGLLILFLEPFVMPCALNKYGTKNYHANIGFRVCLDLSPGLVLSHPGAGSPDALSKA